MIETDEFIVFFGQLVFAPETCSWDSFPEEKKNRFCEQAQKKGLALFFVRFLGKRLPEPYYQKFRQQFLNQSAAVLMESRTLQELFDLFKEKHIPFCPVKGADLAFRIYPDPALRPHGDWDILFHENDCPAVLQLLLKNGWHSFSGYHPKELVCHHYERLFNERCSVEVHRTLPNFKCTQPNAFWDEMVFCQDGSYRLSPEMNLLLISAHAQTDYFTHCSVWKILSDAGYVLLHDKIDWDKVHRLADQWEILRPDVLFSAWHEFFPAGILPAESLNAVHQKLIRDLFEMRTGARHVPECEKTMMAVKKFSIPWIKSKLKFYTVPARICFKYNLKKEQKIKIAFYMFYDFFYKVIFFVCHIKPKNPELQKYFDQLAEVEKLIPRKKS